MPPLDAGLIKTLSPTNGEVVSSGRATIGLQFVFDHSGARIVRVLDGVRSTGIDLLIRNPTRVVGECSSKFRMREVAAHSAADDSLLIA